MGVSDRQWTGASLIGDGARGGGDGGCSRPAVGFWRVRVVAALRAWLGGEGLACPLKSVGACPDAAAVAAAADAMAMAAAAEGSAGSLTASSGSGGRDSQRALTCRRNSHFAMCRAIS